ncbi:MAG: YdeI/OmpD-associated family protein [Bacteroidia bacterium]|nr:YdeI/OmpD-associated family protein [Bacteroidia bacterium]
MTTSQIGKISFTATILQHKEINAAYIVFPYNVEELFDTRGQVKIKALFDGKYEYRGSLAKMGMECHNLGITQEMRAKLQKSFGDSINIELEHDLEKREVIIPEDVVLILNDHPEALKFYENLSFTNKKEYITWITSAKKEETRNKRIGLFIEKLKAGKKTYQQ